jgi:hypothetical protein
MNVRRGEKASLSQNEDTVLEKRKLVESGWSQFSHAQNTPGQKIITAAVQSHLEFPGPAVPCLAPTGVSKHV